MVRRKIRIEDDLVYRMPVHFAGNLFIRYVLFMGHDDHILDFETGRGAFKDHPGSF
jgi:hypothetical protein